MIVVHSFPILQRRCQVQLAVLAFTVTMSAAHAQGQDGNPCGDLQNHYGPMDYRTAPRQSKYLVERIHFNSGVESLRKRSTSFFGGDISYTLKVFPNHYRALLSYQRLAEREKRDPPEEGAYTVECFYERGLRFVPKDPVLRMLYANFLVSKNRAPEALAQLDYVVSSNEEDPLTQFNAGMVFMDMKEYKRALAQAHKVIAMGFSRPELRDRLVAAGQWVDLPTSSDTAASAASAPVAPLPSSAASR